VADDPNVGIVSKFGAPASRREILRKIADQATRPSLPCSIQNLIRLPIEHIDDTRVRRRKN
jgi:hypothetical protein